MLKDVNVFQVGCYWKLHNWYIAVTSKPKTLHSMLCDVVTRGPTQLLEKQI